MTAAFSYLSLVKGCHTPLHTCTYCAHLEGADELLFGEKNGILLPHQVDVSHSIDIVNKSCNAKLVCLEDVLNLDVGQFDLDELATLVFASYSKRTVRRVIAKETNTWYVSYGFDYSLELKDKLLKQSLADVVSDENIINLTVLGNKSMVLVTKLNVHHAIFLCIQSLSSTLAPNAYPSRHVLGAIQLAHSTTLFIVCWIKKTFANCNTGAGEERMDKLFDRIDDDIPCTDGDSCLSLTEAVLSIISCIKDILQEQIDEHFILDNTVVQNTIDALATMYDILVYHLCNYLALVKGDKLIEIFTGKPALCQSNIKLFFSNGYQYFPHQFLLYLIDILSKCGRVERNLQQADPLNFCQILSTTHPGANKETEVNPLLSAVSLYSKVLHLDFVVCSKRNLQTISHSFNIFDLFSTHWIGQNSNFALAVALACIKTKEESFGYVKNNAIFAMQLLDVLQWYRKNRTHLTVSSC